MRKKLENYIKKYSTLENFRAFGSQEEKDDYLLTERSIIVSYDDHFLQVQHNLDNLINTFTDNVQNKEYYYFERNDTLFSMYAELEFIGETNLYNPKDYHCSLPNRTSFNSLYQYIIFHKAILFLDRETAYNILKAKSMNQLILLGEGINNIDKGVWCKYRIEIAEKGIRNILKSNDKFESALFSINNKVLVFLDESIFWGVDPIQRSKLNMTRCNYLGKILTKISQELR
ncbi:MAG: ribA/ribD-fused uncharacterized protein [Halioglobus sp.]|jgi:ribA/ribD-fused uncharacterized protein